MTWLSRETGKKYRLLTEAEREYVTRAGTTSPYWWGTTISDNQANYDTRPRQSAQDAEAARVATKTAGPKKMGKSKNKPELTHAEEKTAAAPPDLRFRGGTVPVHFFQPNPWGLYQVHGNVAEWVQDCWGRTYHGAPADGSAATSGDCSKRVIRGGSWNFYPEDLRAAYREAGRANQAFVVVGFRVARELT